MDLGERIAGEALTLVGVRFRLHGRCEQDGLDCVGLVMLALARAGRSVPQVPAYGLRGFSRISAEQCFEAAGFARTAQARPGDVLLVESGPMQLHLMLTTGRGFVHAHAGLGRVVLMPSPPWPVLGQWRADA